jgi:hypothetical protein
MTGPAPTHNPTNVWAPQERTSVGVYHNGCKELGWDIVGSPEVALAKAYDDLCARAKCGALGKGLWQVSTDITTRVNGKLRTQTLVEELTVD